MELKISTLDELDIEPIIKYEKQKLIDQGIQEMEISLIQWDSKWRHEYLQNYVKAGWSFVVRQNNILMGYFLAQPLLFFNGQTQSLWVDAISSHDREAYELMVDTFVKLGKEKHLQQVYIPDELVQQRNHANPIKGLEKLQTTDQKLFFIKTTKG